MNDIGASLSSNPRNAREIAKLREIGIDPGQAYRAYRDSLGGKTAAWDKIVNRAGMNLSNKTQFLNRSENLPYFFQSPFGRTATMFKGFLVMQTRFLRDLILPDFREYSWLPKKLKGPRLLKGKSPGGFNANFLRLLLFPVLGVASGEIAADIKALVVGRRRPDEMAGRLIENMMMVGSAGIALDMLTSLSSGRTQTTEFFMGPTFGNISRIIGDLGGAGAKMANVIANGEEFDYNKIFGATTRNIAGQSIGFASEAASRFGLTGRGVQIALQAGGMMQQTAGRVLAPPQNPQYQAVSPGEDYVSTVLTGESSQERMDKLIKQIRRLRRNGSAMEAAGF